MTDFIPGRTSTAWPAVVSSGFRADIPVASRNQLLAALLSQARQDLLPYLKPVYLAARDVLVDVDEPLTQCYFPQGSTAVSMIRVFRDGRMSEMATIGNEGVVPVSAPCVAQSSLARCVVQTPGPGLALEAARLRSVGHTHAAVGRALNVFITTLLFQVLQSAACNAVHTAEQRCARWLLTATDRSGSDSLALTHEVMAETLGVHRPTVSVVARSLQQAGIIRYRRGAITIADRLRLEQAACECYVLDRERRERLSRLLVGRD